MLWYVDLSIVYNHSLIMLTPFEVKLIYACFQTLNFVYPRNSYRFQPKRSVLQNGLVQRVLLLYIDSKRQRIKPWSQKINNIKIPASKYYKGCDLSKASGSMTSCKTKRDAIFREHFDMLNTSPQRIPTSLLLLH